MAYTTYTDAKLYLKIPVATTTDDTLLTTLIARAQAAIDSFCRQTFEASADTTRYFDPTRDTAPAPGGYAGLIHDDTRMLVLDAPLAQITTVTNGDSTAVASSKYITEPRNTTPWHALILKSNAGISWTYTTAPENSIAIVGRWAYSITAPADIVHATIRLAAYLYRQRGNAADLDRAMAMGDAMLFPAELPRDIQAFLFKGGYRRLVV